MSSDDAPVFQCISCKSIKNSPPHFQTGIDGRDFKVVVLSICTDCATRNPTIPSVNISDSKMRDLVFTCTRDKTGVSAQNWTELIPKIMKKYAYAFYPAKFERSKADNNVVFLVYYDNETNQTLQTVKPYD